VDDVDILPHRNDRFATEMFPVITPVTNSTRATVVLRAVNSARSRLAGERERLNEKPCGRRAISPGDAQRSQATVK